MEFVLGLLTAVVLFLLLATAFYFGYKRGKKKSDTNTISEQEKRRQKEIQEHFQSLFNYDLDTALKGKKVR